MSPFCFFYSEGLVSVIGLGGALKQAISGRLPLTLECLLGDVLFYLRTPKGVGTSGGHRSSIQLMLNNKLMCDKIKTPRLLGKTAVRMRAESTSRRRAWPYVPLNTLAHTVTTTTTRIAGRTGDMAAPLGRGGGGGLPPRSAAAASAAASAGANHNSSSGKSTSYELVRMGGPGGGGGGEAASLLHHLIRFDDGEDPFGKGQPPFFCYQEKEEIVPDAEEEAAAAAAAGKGGGGRSGSLARRCAGRWRTPPRCGAAPRAGLTTGCSTTASPWPPPRGPPTC